jgi:Fe-S cluster biosynthesis and repair protein YggX
MEKLSEEGRAIFETIAKEAAAQHARNQKEIKVLICNNPEHRNIERYI